MNVPLLQKQCWSSKYWLRCMTWTAWEPSFKYKWNFFVERIKRVTISNAHQIWRDNLEYSASYRDSKPWWGRDFRGNLMIKCFIPRFERITVSFPLWVMISIFWCRIQLGENETGTAHDLMILLNYYPSQEIIILLKTNWDETHSDHSSPKKGHHLLV